MIRCVVSFIFYPMSMGTWFIRALQRRDDVELFTVGPYTGSWIPWNGGMDLPVKNIPSLPLPYQPMPNMSIGYVESRLPWQPDLWLHIDAGWHLKGKPQHGKNVFVATDPHVLDYTYQRSLADIFYCMQSPYLQRGDIWLPYAYDPTVHYQENTPVEFDACLIGLLYNERAALINELRQRGLEVHYSIGPVFDEYRQLYNRSIFSLCWSSKQDLCARVFEGLAMGDVVASNRVPDLKQLFREDEHYIGFDSVGEAVEKILYYNQNLDQSFEIAKAGQAAVQPHTWDARIATILEAV